MGFDGYDDTIRFNDPVPVYAGLSANMANSGSRWVMRNAAAVIIEVTGLGLRNSRNMTVKGSMPTRRRASLDVSFD